MVLASIRREKHKKDLADISFCRGLVPGRAENLPHHLPADRTQNYFGQRLQCCTFHPLQRHIYLMNVTIDAVLIPHSTGGPYLRMSLRQQQAAQHYRVLSDTPILYLPRMGQPVRQGLWSRQRMLFQVP